MDSGGDERERSEDGSEKGDERWRPLGAINQRSTSGAKINP